MQFVKDLRYATINAGDHTRDGVGTNAAVEGNSADQPNDVLDVIFTQDQIIADLFGVWHQASEQLSHADDVDLRWRRGSDVKLLLQHLAVREAMVWFDADLLGLGEREVPQARERLPYSFPVTHRRCRRRGGGT
jgi:membrane-anchored protein YejM (alkaline phosphatase superfamily)